MTTNGAPAFPRARHGYQQAAVDEFIWLEGHTKQSLLDENQLLHNQLSEAMREVAALKTEVATLYDVSTAPQSVAHRISHLLHTTVEELSKMQSEARCEAAALVSSAKTTAEALLSEAQAEAGKIVASARAEADTLVEEANASALKQLQEAERAAEKVTRQHISTLQQLAAVHRNLSNVPAVLDSAYRRRGDAHVTTSGGGSAKITDGVLVSERRTYPYGVAKQSNSEDLRVAPGPETSTANHPDPVHETQSPAY